MVAGLIVGNNGWGCTIGFVADYPSGGGRGLVTASHCTKDVGGSIWSVDGFPANQHPAGAFIGNEVGDPPPWGCGVFQLCRRSDASFYRNMSTRTLERGLIARPNAIGSSDVDVSQPYFIIAGSNNGFVGQELWKIGRQSGWRVGTIANTCVDHSISGDDFPEYQRTVVCGGESSAYNTGGDSGGPVFLSVGGPFVYLSGTTIGRPEGTSFTRYSTISQIQLDYAGTLSFERAAALGTPAVTGSMPSGNPNLNWPQVAGAASYAVYRQSSVGGPYSSLGSTTSLNYVDPTVATVGVSSSPPGNGAPFAAYQVRASNTTDVSPFSSTVYFQRPATITVTIEGQSGVKPWEGCYWTASATGGTGNYSYQWTVNSGGTFANSPQLYYEDTGSNFTLAVIVTDGSSIAGNDQRTVSVSASNPTSGF